MEGFMYKRGRGESTFGNRSWKKRWFVLDGNYLSFFENFNVRTNLPENKEGVIPIFGCEIRQLPNYDRSFSFEISHPDRLPLICSCDDDNKLNIWLSALSVAASERVVANISFDQYYETVGLPVDKPYTLKELDRAFRKTALKVHPDKGGDIKQFKALQEAYEVLKSKLDEIELDRQYETIYFEATIRKGPPGIGLGIKASEDPKKKIVFVQDVFDNIQIMDINPPGITDGLNRNDRFILAGDDDISSWPLSRVAERLSDFRVPVGSDIVLQFSRKVPNANFKGIIDAATGRGGGGGVDDRSGISSSKDNDLQGNDDADNDGSGNINTQELQQILNEHEDMRQQILNFPSEFKRLQFMNNEKTEIIEDITEENDKMKKDIRTLQLALEESKRREAYLELQLRQSVLTSTMTEDMLIRSLKDMVKVSNAVQADKQFEVAPELNDYLAQSGFSEEECRQNSTKKSVRVAICAMASVDKTNNMMTKWSLSGEDCISRLNKLESKIKQLQSYHDPENNF